MTVQIVRRADARRLPIVLRLAASSLLLGALSACGGEDGGSGGGMVTVPTPSPSPTPAPSPTPSPSPTPMTTGQVASVATGTIPIGATDIVTDFKATNAGLYMKVTYAADGKPNAIIKLRGTPAFSDAWYIATPVTANGSFVSDYAPSNPYSETREGISIYWGGRTSEGGGKDRWGIHVANTGDISTYAEQAAFGYYGIQRVASGARSGVAAARPWVQRYIPTTIGNSGYSVYQDDGQYTKPNDIEDRFGTAATPPLTGTADIMLSHPDKGELFVGVGNALHVYSATVRLRGWTFPESGAITDMMWVNGTLYLSQGSRIWKTDGSAAPTSIASIGASLGVPGRFCISGGEAFLPNGEAIDLTTNTRRSWLKKGTLTTAQASEAQQLEIAVLAGAGVYCSSYATGTVIYVPSQMDRTVRAITPVAK